MLSRRDAANLSDFHIAFPYAGLGDANAVFAQLNRAYARRDPDLPYFNVDPILNECRADPRFIEMLRKLRLQD